MIFACSGHLTYTIKSPKGLFIFCKVYYMRPLCLLAPILNKQYNINKIIFNDRICAYKAMPCYFTLKIFMKDYSE